MKWERLREEEFEAAIERSGGLCVMAVGCIEKHGQHLPVGTDSLKGDKIVELASERADVMMFPTTMWLGDVTGARVYDPQNHHGHYGYVAMNPETLISVLEELCDEISRNGFKKILFCSSHGGNSAMLSYFMRSMAYKKKDYIPMCCKAYNFSEIAPDKMLAAAENDPEYFSMLTKADLETLRKFAVTGTGGGHADFGETALVYGTHPELVAPDKFDAEDGLSIKRVNYPREFGITDGVNWDANFPNAFSGFAPIGCSETIGQAAVKMSVDRLAKIFEYLKRENANLDVINERLTY